MTEIIDRDRAVELLEKVVEAKGRDYIYESPLNEHGQQIGCVYFGPNNCPACVVGHVFAELQVKPGDVHAMGEDGTADGPGNSLGVEGIVIDNVEMTSAAREVFQMAQERQDEGNRWGDALDAAKDLAVTL